MPDIALDLRYFDSAILVAERGSFRAAADSVGLPQSTVSRRVQLLERQLGFLLFDRTRSGAQLTCAGERFLRSAEFGRNELRLAILETRTALRGELGELRLGVPTSFAAGPLGAMLADYRKAYSQVVLRLDEVAWPVASVRLLSRCLDIAFLAGEPRFADATAEKMWNERFVVALPKDHPLAKSSGVRWADIRDETFLCVGGDQGSHMESLLKSKLASDCQRPRICLHNIGRDDLLGLVARGFGLFVTLESAVSDRYPDVEFIAITDGDDQVEFSAVWLSDVRNPTVKPFVQFIRSHPLRIAAYSTMR